MQFLIIVIFCALFYRFSCQKAFRDVLTEINDQAGQHEVVAENLTSAVSKEIVALVKDFKEDRKRVILFSISCRIFPYLLFFNTSGWFIVHKCPQEIC